MPSKKYPIYHVSFKTQYLLTATLLRFNESNENAAFRKKKFSWEAFMDWYAEKHGKFSYLEDITGYCLPSDVLKPFSRGFYDPLTKKEKAFLRMFRRVPRPFAFIATTREEKGTIPHEFVHALYFLFPEYRKAVEECIAELNPEKLRKHFLEETYAHGRHDVGNEINAYILTGLVHGMGTDEVKPLRRELRRTFREQFGYNLPSRTKANKFCRARMHNWTFRM